jgi:hypothetical protein
VITFSFPLISGGPSSGGGTGSLLTSQFSGLPSPTIAFSELAIDPVTGDLAMPPYIVKGADAVVQKMRQRFRMFKGEWFLDLRLGVPYLQSIFIKNPSQVLINTIFTKVLTGTPGVSSVASFNGTLDRATRALVSDFQAVLVDGTSVIAQAEPFIIGAS